MSFFSSEERTYLAYGQGRSYGDVCLNENGILIDTSDTSTLLTFDEETGIIQCEAGITFDELLKITVNSGWFLPVVPGTRFITLGGAIANDIHGKNHHNSGSFGNFVKEFELLRSDNTKMVCNAQINSNYFHATIGGMGLTGVITWAKIQLKRINNSYLNTQTFRFTGIEEYRQLNNKLET